MENSSSSTNLDHPSKFIKKDDPMYPCNILDKKYLELCYRYQSSHFAIITQSNWVETAKLCLQVPKEYQKACFLTIGSNQVGFTQDFPTIINDCNLMPNDWAKDFCFQGAVDALAIRYRADFQKGIQFCSMVESKFQQGCFSQYGLSVSSWSNNSQKRIELCDSIGNLKFSNWCKGTQASSSPFILMLKKLWAKLSSLSKLFAKKTDNQNLQTLSFNQQMNVLKEISTKDGAQKTWQILAETFKDQGGASGNIHDLAHFVGGLIFDASGFEGLAVCTPQFAFGCFHGLLDKAFKDGLNNLPKAETGCQKINTLNSGPYASCIHGIGHGVASFFQVSDLKNALLSCEKVKDGKDYCYDGVFMEFARNAPLSFYKKDDPLYPCNQLEEKYVFACGRNQPQLLMQRFKISFEKVADLCIKAQSQNFQQSCATALGFITAANSYGQAEGILANCNQIKNPNYQVQCATSAAGELIFQNMPGWKEQAPKVCEGLAEANKISCQTYLQAIMKDYHRS